MAEGNATIHAPRCLATQHFLLRMGVKFLPVSQALQRRFLRWRFALIF